VDIEHLNLAVEAGTSLGLIIRDYFSNALKLFLSNESCRLLYASITLGLLGITLSFEVLSL
jgi:hypothetical protein